MGRGVGVSRRLPRPDVALCSASVAQRPAVRLYAARSGSDIAPMGRGLRLPRLLLSASALPIGSDPKGADQLTRRRPRARSAPLIGGAGRRGFTSGVIRRRVCEPGVFRERNIRPRAPARSAARFRFFPIAHNLIREDLVRRDLLRLKSQRPQELERDNPPVHKLLNFLSLRLRSTARHGRELGSHGRL